MRISYFPDEDYLHISLRDEARGSVAGEDMAPGVVLLTDDDGAAIELEVDSASERLDLSRLEVEGLPIGVTRKKSQESRAG